MCTNSLSLYQYKNGYRYNSDSIILYDFISSFTCKGEILDVGCGCGILGLLIKRDFDLANITLLDIQEKNVILAKENAKINNLHVDVKKGDFLDCESKCEYDFIISNPPFYDKGSQKSTDEHLAKSRYSEHLPFEEFAKKAYQSLKHRGKFCFCYDAKQLSFVLSLLSSAGFAVEKMRFVHSKKENSASLVLIFAVKNSKGMCEIMPPFFTNDADGHTKEAKEIFIRANTKSLTWT